MPASPDDDPLLEDSDDSDFVPDEHAGPRDASSSEEDDEEDGSPIISKKREADDKIVVDNSGDEAIIEKARKREKKKTKKKNKNKNKINKKSPAEKTAHGHDEDSDVDDAGTVGRSYVKTRQMRAAEKTERRYTTTPKGPVTVDIDSLWAQMKQQPIIPRPGGPSTDPQEPREDEDNDADGDAASASHPKEKSLRTQTMVRIERTYQFAGQVHMETKLVPQHSAEAQVYLATHPDAGLVQVEERRPSAKEGGEDAVEEEEDEAVEPPYVPRKAFRSRFEPIFSMPASGGTPLLSGSGGSSTPLSAGGEVASGGARVAGRVPRTDLQLGLQARLQARQQRGSQAVKLNTVEKSRLDWAGYVDEAGLQEELVLAGKSKDSFASRQAFLARSEALREEEARKLRTAGRA